MFILSVSSCTKAKNPRWLVGDINFVDAVTKAPVVAKLELSYYAYSAFGSEKETKSLGLTDDDGFYTLHEKFGRNDRYFELIVYAKGYYGLPYADFADKIIELSTTSKNDLTIEIEPVLLSHVFVSNTDCYNETDSLWVKFPHLEQFSPTVHTGCLDHVPITGDYFWGWDQDVEFTTISKRDGVYDTLVHPIHLEYHTINEIHLNY